MKKFKVHIDRDRDYYWRVQIYRTQAQMLHAINRMNRFFGTTEEVNSGSGRTAAMVCMRDYLKLEHYRLGTIYFHVGKVGGGVVSHEMTHAAMYFWWNVEDRPWDSLRSDKEAEEAFALAQGHLVSDFWNNWWPRCDKWAEANKN